MRQQQIQRQPRRRRDEPDTWVEPADLSSDAGDDADDTIAEIDAALDEAGQ